MTYQVMARKYRPQSFEAVIGQDHVTRTLQNAIRSERIGHAYLFSGPRGVGKTTTARILAKAINCQEGPTPTPCNHCSFCQEITQDRSLDVLEIDGASNTHVADIQELRESVKYAPTRGQYKIYIVDEVHMLSKHAFNALLKTLEEPPAHVVFIFATTELWKIPLTILSRCQRFDFRLITAKQILQRLADIAQEEKIQVEQGALALIARRAEGSMRDGQSLLEQVISYGGREVTEEMVSEALGLATRDVFFQLLEAVRLRNSKEVLDLVAAIEDQGWDMEDFVDGLLDHLRYLLLTKIDSQSAELSGFSRANQQRYGEQAAQVQEEDLLRMMGLISETQKDMKYNSRPRFLLEMLAVKLAKMESTVHLGELLEDLDRVLGGNRAAPVEPLSETVSPQRSVVSEPAQPVPHTQPAPKIQLASQAQPAQPPQQAVGETGDLWDQVIDRVTKQKSALGALLQHGQLGQVEERVVTISFPKSCNFHRERAEMKKNREVIEGETSALLGRDVRVRFSLADIPEPSMRLRVDMESKNAPPSPEKIIQAEPIIGDILENLDGELIT